MPRPFSFADARAPWRAPTRGGVTTSTNGQVISDAIIEANGTAITVAHNNVTIKNCKIVYNCSGQSTAYGIYASGKSGLTVIDCEIINMGIPMRGEAGSTTQSCVRMDNGGDLTIARVTVRGGSTGVQLVGITNSDISFLEGHDIRGPQPRGSVIQWASCLGTHTAVDMSSEVMPGTSHPEDSFSVFKTPNVTMERIKAPLGTDGPSGRGLVIEGPQSVDCVVNNAEFDWVYNGAVAIGETYGETGYPDRFSVTNIKTRNWNRYGIRGWAGSSGKTPTGYPPLTFAAQAEVEGILTAKYISRGYSPSDTWNLSNIVNVAATLTYEDWTSTLSVVRNAFPWRPTNRVPTLDLPPRIGSYDLPGDVGGGGLVTGSVLALLPGRYKHDPTSRAWQWRKNGTPISGATGLNYVLVSGDLGASIDCVETPANSNGAGTAVATAPVSVPA